MKLKVVLETSEEGGYTVHVPSLPGCISEGDTKEEAVANIREAIELYLKPTEDDYVPQDRGEVLELALWARSPASPIERSFVLSKEMGG